MLPRLADVRLTNELDALSFTRLLKGLSDRSGWAVTVIGDGRRVPVQRGILTSTGQVQVLSPMGSW